MTTTTDYKLGVGFVNIRKARPDSAVANWTQEEQSMIYTWQRNPSASMNAYPKGRWS